MIFIYVISNRASDSRKSEDLRRTQLWVILDEVLVKDTPHTMRMLHILMTLCLVAMLAEQAHAGPPARIMMIGYERCFDGPPLKERLQNVLTTHTPKERALPSVTVGVSQSSETLQVSLRLVNTQGAPMLNRSYALSPSDCSDVPDLLELVVVEALRELPLEAWAQEPIDASGPKSVLGSTLRLSAHSDALRLNSMVSGALSVPLWKSNHDQPLLLRLGVQVGIGPWHDLDDGDARETTYLGTLESRIPLEQIHVGLTLLGGVGHFRGLSVPKSKSAWVPWFEIAAEAGTSLGEIHVFVQLATPLLQHRLEVAGSESAYRITPLRIGLGLEVPL